ncbi:MAG: ester cyclase [Bacillota bacterium]|nr:ester cyclase [Bacillota bacterium]
MNEKEKERFKNAILEGWHKGNFEAWDEYYAPDCTFHKPPFADLPNLEAAKESTRESRNAYSNIKVDIPNIVFEGNLSTWQYAWKAKHTGQSPSLPIPPTNKDVTLVGCLINRWEGGKIVEEWEYSDYLGFLQQLGVIPPMG